MGGYADEHQYDENGAPLEPVEGEFGEEEEIPLLEDLDIDVDMVKSNLKSVILFKKFEHKFTEDPDMTGPVLVGFSLAMALILVSFQYPTHLIHPICLFPIHFLTIPEFFKILLTIF